jgi:hypothetical protein
MKIPADAGRAILETINGRRPNKISDLPPRLLA